jgi:hypothetical protein
MMMTRDLMDFERNVTKKIMEMTMMMETEAASLW